MGVRANWHTDLPEVDADDPFDALQRTDVQDVGQPIDLTTSEPSLNKRLVELVRDEQRLYTKGIECAIKDRPDSCCSACPVHGRFGELCRIGRDQERVSTYLSVLRERDRGQT